MPVSFTVKNPAALKKQMGRLVSEAGYSSTAALKYGAVSLCRSLRARTRKAPPLRRLNQVEGGFSYKVFKNGQSVKRFVSAKSRDNAKRSRAVIIRYSGLAKTAWGWAMNDLFGTAPGDNGRFKRPQSAIKASKSPTKIVINNRLKYAMEALKNGPSSLAEASLAASNLIRKTIERRLAKAAK